MRNLELGDPGPETRIHTATVAFFRLKGGNISAQGIALEKRAKSTDPARKGRNRNRAGRL
jgi:hypothetical protein